MCNCNGEGGGVPGDVVAFLRGDFPTNNRDSYRGMMWWLNVAVLRRRYDTLCWVNELAWWFDAQGCGVDERVHRFLKQKYVSGKYLVSL